MRVGRTYGILLLMSGDITRILQDSGGMESLLPLVYGELKRLANAKIDRERDVITMGATGLLHEAYLRLMKDSGARFENRAHFFAAAGEAMRRILVERARALATAKRGERPTRIALGDDALPGGDDRALAVEVVSLDRALSDLEARDLAMATVVKLRFFGGLTVDETASALNVSPRTVNRTWTAARAWLKVQLDTA